MGNLQIIYNTLRAAGLTEAACLGMMGNWQCESGLEANRVQGDFDSFRSVSKNYTERLTNGSLSKEAFCKDAKGYGLAQWTYWTRKAALYDFWKSQGGRIDDPALQTKFALSELVNDYSNLLSTLRRETDLYTCTKLICVQFERPAVNNIDARFAAAKRVKEQINLAEQAPAEPSEPTVKPQEPAEEIPTWALRPATGYWPPRMLCKGMKGKDVEVVIALLKAREFGINYIGDTFTDLVEEAVKRFQKVYHLEADGVVGPLTWGALLALN